MSVYTPGDEDRRRSRRFSCCGAAKIICLPSNGLSLPGRLRDLSLGGCCLDTIPGLGCGARTELIVRVNSGSFRAMSQVKGVWDKSRVGMEFIRLSSSGKDMLADVLDRLARLQALVNELRSARRGIDTERLVKQHFPILGALLPQEPSEQTGAGADSELLAVQEEMEIIRLDLFI